MRLPVPKVYDASGEAGIIMQEDLGSRQLFQVFEEASGRTPNLLEAMTYCANSGRHARAIERDSVFPGSLLMKRS
jgi:hypothetical protein